ncbi:hypothetical protein GC177_04395 [bacterium]|nr:hypothetical protein [bacterium]
MEINEAETYRHQAVENRSFSLTNLVSPFRYPSTAMNADKAITATEQRSAYLKQIYGIRRCGSPETKLQEARMAQPPYVQPQQAYMQPQQAHMPPQAVMRGYAPAPYNQAPYQANTFNGQNAMQMAAPSSAPPANWPAPPPPIGAYPPAGVPVQPASPPPMAQAPVAPPPVEQAAALPIQPGGNAPSAELTPPDEAQPVDGVPVLRQQPGYMEF